MAETNAPTPFGTPIAPAQVACKVCGAMAGLAGVVDFNKNCEQRRAQILPVAGVPIYYHRCTTCGLLFTVALDGFASSDFKRWIYNDDYIKVDPDYLDLRPRSNAQMLAQSLGQNKSLRMLDYGGGTGKLAESLRAGGFTDVHSYDPVADPDARRPEGQFDFICAFEVLEHTTTPRETLADMISLLRDPGLLMFSTLVQGKEFEMYGIGWWYIAPRNGHVTLYSRPSLQRLGERLGYRFGSYNDNLHVMVRNVPPFAAGWFQNL